MFTVVWLPMTRVRPWSAPRLGRIDLARHDRRARLVFRQDQFAEAGARAGAEEADVVGDLEQVAASALSAPWNAPARRGSPAPRTCSRRANGRPVIRRHCRRTFGETVRRVEAGADGGAALGERMDVAERRSMRSAPVPARRVAGELLAERQRRRILQCACGRSSRYRRRLPPSRAAPRACALSAGISRHPPRPTAMCIAVGNVSLEDWPALT
jgi:hypothetical protein